MMNTCSCMSVTPSSAVSICPRAVLSSDTKLMLSREAVHQQRRLQYVPSCCQSQPPAAQISRQSLGEIMAATVEFFESAARPAQADDHERACTPTSSIHRQERIFASLLTPASTGPTIAAGHLPDQRIRRDHRFYGLSYWYRPSDRTGPGPIWMSDNEDASARRPPS